MKEIQMYITKYRNHKITGTSAIKNEKGLRVPVILIEFFEIISLFKVFSGFQAPEGILFDHTDGEADTA